MLEVKNNHSQNLSLFLLTIYCLFAGLLNAHFIEYENARAGWSPSEWINSITIPSVFEKNFKTGIEIYANSLFMYIYILANKLGFAVINVTKIVIITEPLALGFSSWIFANTIFKRRNLFVPLIFSIFVLEGSIGSTDLARFGSGYYWGLFYNYSEAAGFLLIAAIMKNRLILATILAVFSVLTHPIIGGFFLCFSFPFIFHLFKINNKIFLLTLGSSFLCVVYFWMRTTILGDLIPEANHLYDVRSYDWFEVSKIFQYHWFPLDLGVFSDIQHKHFMPFISVSILTIFFFIKNKEQLILERFYISGLIILVLLTFVGVLFSIQESSDTLIKLSLHRASKYYLYLSLPLLIYLFVSEAGSDHQLKRFFIILCVFSIFSETILPPFLIVIFSGFMIVEFIRSENPKTKLIYYIPLVYIFLLVLNYYIFPNQLKYFFPEKNLLYFGLFILAIHFFNSLILQRKLASKNYAFFRVVLACSFIVISVIGVSKKSNFVSYLNEKNRDIYAAQLWAKNNTPKNALFFVDPTSSGSWVGSAERASFGTIKQWLHTSSGYKKKDQNSMEGFQRFAVYDVELSEYFNRTPSVRGSQELLAYLSKYQFENDCLILKRFALKYEIDFFVLKRKSTGSDCQTIGNVVFQNQTITVISNEL